MNAFLLAAVSLGVNVTVSSVSTSLLTRCAAGQYSPDGVTTCAACNAGMFQGNSGAVTCMSCTAGKYSSLSATACSLCSSGYFQSSLGRSSCNPCASGTDLQLVGAVIPCTAFPTFDPTPGPTARPSGSPTPSPTINCGAGYEFHLITRTCVACAAGKYTDHLTCMPCSVGQ